MRMSRPRGYRSRRRGQRWSARRSPAGPPEPGSGSVHCSALPERRCRLVRREQTPAPRNRALPRSRRRVRSPVHLAYVVGTGRGAIRGGVGRTELADDLETPRVDVHGDHRSVMSLEAGADEGPDSAAPNSTTELPRCTPERRTLWIPTASGCASAAESTGRNPGSPRSRCGCGAYVANPPSVLSPRVKYRTHRLRPRRHQAHSPHETPAPQATRRPIRCRALPPRRRRSQ